MLGILESLAYMSQSFPYSSKSMHGIYNSKVLYYWLIRFFKYEYEVWEHAHSEIMTY
jgi:hypothetical protein